MRRHRREWLRPAADPSPLNQATGVLPSFNFIEPKAPKPRPHPPAATQLPSLNPSRGSSRSNNQPLPTAHADRLAVECDGIVHQTLLRWAQELEEPTLNDESKIVRLWQSLLRHSEAGRFSTVTEYSPNPICSFIAMELLQQILQASGVSLMLVNLLVGAVGNSIFAHYTPEQPQHELQQHADIAADLRNQLALKREELAATKKQVSVHKSQLAAFQIAEQERDGSTVQDKAQLITAVLRSIDEPTHVPLVITDALTPFLNDEMMLVLWNATARITASHSLAAEDDTDDTTSTSIVDNRKRASSLAARVLQERVRLMLTQWYTLSAEERGVVSSRLAAVSADHNQGGLALKGILQALEEVYISEQVRDKSAPRRSMFLSPMARHGSVIARPTAQEKGSTARMPMPPAARASRTMSMYFNPAAQATQATPPLPALTNVSIPDVLFGALSDGQHVAATDESKLLIEQLSNEQDEILNRCEDIFDLLCRDPIEALASKRVSESVIEEEEDEEEADSDSGDGTLANAQLAKQRLCELLCNYVDAPSYIMEKFEKSEAVRVMREQASRESEDGNGTCTTVQTIIQWQKQNPTVLVNAINQSPEILLTAISQNNGILRFAITKFAPLVKRFLRLDLKACEHLDVLAHKNKGVQLLWGTNSTAGPTVSSTSASANAGGRGGGHQQTSADDETGTSLLAVNDVLDDVMGRRTSILSILADTSGSPTRGAALGSAEIHLLQWFSAHTADLATLALKRPDLLKPLFVEMHTQGDVGPFYKVMMQLTTTKGVQNYFHRASITTLERIAQEDPAEVTRLLREILRDPPNRDLVHQLQTAPYLTTCLSEFHPTLIQDVISSDMDTWKQYFVETVAADDAMLKESLVTRVEDLEGSETLIQLFSAVVSATTSGLNLTALDFGASPTDVTRAKEREVASRRKMAQCTYLRGGVSVFRSLVAQLVATVGYHPHEVRIGTGSASLAGAAHRTSASHVMAMKAPPARANGKKTHRGSSNTSPRKRPQNSITKKDEVAGSVLDPNADSPPGSRGSGVFADHGFGNSLHAHMPLMWQSFVHAFQRHQLQHSVDAEFRVPTLSRAHTKTLILDLWIEFLKVDTLQLDNSCLWTMAPFVCDCLVTRYDSPLVVGAWIHALTEALTAFQDDPRVAFFATACGLRLHSTQISGLDGYDTFLYYAHALGHLLFGQMKVFKPECRLEETADGSCAVAKAFVTSTAARLFDHRLLSGNEINDLMLRLETLPVAVDPEKQIETLELDDAMQVFLDQWRIVNSHLDERYRVAFRLSDPSGSDTIGLEQFTKIVTNVTQQRISPRECLLVYCDVGEELLDLETLLRVTHVYHLRLFNLQLPEIALDDDDFQALKLSTGRSNIFSPTREVEDLLRFWRGLRAEVRFQVDSPHQSKSTKMHLKKQTALIDKLLGEIQVHAQPSGTATSGGVTPAIRLRSPPSQSQPTGAAVAQGVAPQVLQKAWQELRACAKMLNAAKLTQHYLSRLYIQTCIVRWIRQTRKRRARLAAEAEAALAEARERDETLSETQDTA